MAQQDPLISDIHYAGFWRRFLAAFIDTIIIWVAGIGLCILLLANMLTAGMTELFITPIAVVVNWLYFTGMESSSSQATLGKKILGIKITDVEGNQINFRQANIRFLSKYISTFIFFIGFVMAAFTERKQALHDLIADTLVIKKKSATNAIIDRQN